MARADLEQRATLQQDAQRMMILHGRAASPHYRHGDDGAVVDAVDEIANAQRRDGPISLRRGDRCVGSGADGAHDLAPLPDSTFAANGELAAGATLQASLVASRTRLRRRVRATCRRPDTSPFGRINGLTNRVLSSVFAGAARAHTAVFVPALEPRCGALRACGRLRSRAVGGQRRSSAAIARLRDHPLALLANTRGAAVRPKVVAPTAVCHVEAGARSPSAEGHAGAAGVGRSRGTSRCAYAIRPLARAAATRRQDEQQL
jgi:hypothetical protein